jgi:GDP-mannose transporter
MTDKKNEDYVVRMGDDYGKKEKDTFLARSPTRSAYGSNMHGNSLEQLEKSPPLSIVAYCFSSISMTVVNKYVVSGSFWNLNFFYLTVQVCLLYMIGV